MNEVEFDFLERWKSKNKNIETETNLALDRFNNLPKKKKELHPIKSITKMKTQNKNKYVWFIITKNKKYFRVELNPFCVKLLQMANKERLYDLRFVGYPVCAHKRPKLLIGNVPTALILLYFSNFFYLKGVCKVDDSFDL